MLSFHFGHCPDIRFCWVSLATVSLLWFRGHATEPLPSHFDVSRLSPLSSWLEFAAFWHNYATCAFYLGYCRCLHSWSAILGPPALRWCSLAWSLIGACVFSLCRVALSTLQFIPTHRWDEGSVCAFCFVSAVLWRCQSSNVHLACRRALSEPLSQ